MTSLEAGFDPTDEELRQGIVDPVDLGLGVAVVQIYAWLRLDGELIETLALNEMIKRQDESH